MRRGKATLLWLIISVSAGALISYLADLSFWICVPIAAVAFLLNGWLADREDNGKFND